jgi:hypothetical protein
VTDATFARSVAIAVGVLALAALAWWLSTVVLLLFASVILASFIRTVSEVIEKWAGLIHRLRTLNQAQVTPLPLPYRIGRAGDKTASNGLSPVSKTPS